MNSPYEFLAFSGIIGLGHLLAEGDIDLIKTLRRYASDPRWRIREGVAMALQRLGDVNMEQLIGAMREWGQGTSLEQRSAAAALCEPRLLGQSRHPRAVLAILDQITVGIEQVDNRRSEDFLTLVRAGLLLECSGRGSAGRGQSADGEVAGQAGQRCTLDYEGELEEEAVDSDGC